MYKYYFSILFSLLLNTAAYADLQSSYQRRIDLYNQLIEYNHAEAVQIEQKIKSAFDSLKNNRKSISDLFSNYKTLGFAGAIKNNGAYIAKILGAGIAAYQMNDEIPTIEELEKYLETISSPEELEQIYLALQDAYTARIQEIERLQKRRDELLSSNINWHTDWIYFFKNPTVFKYK